MSRTDVFDMTDEEFRRYEAEEEFRNYDYEDDEFYNSYGMHRDEQGRIIP